MHKLCIDRAILRVLQSLTFTTNKNRFEKLVTTSGYGKQLNQVRYLKRALMSSPNNPHIVEEMKSYIRLPLQNKQYKLAEEISKENLVHCLDPKDLREAAFWLYSAINKEKLSRYQLSILLRTLRNYYYQFDHRDSVFLQNLTEALQGPADLAFFPYITFKDAVTMRNFFSIPHLENVCREYSKLSSVDTNFGVSRYGQIIQTGLEHDVWSVQFKKELYGLGQFVFKNLDNSDARRLNKLVKMAVCQNRQDCVIEPRKENSTISNTEIKIHNYLKELGYNFVAGPLINGFEVDFLIGDRIVLEYNGCSHYCINRPKELRRYNKYMYRRLEQMGFQVNQIEFDKWQPMQYKQKQMKYLIDKVEQRAAKPVEQYFSSCRKHI